MKVETPAVGINIYRDVYDATRLIELCEIEGAKDWPRLEWEHSTENTPDGGVRQSDYRSSLSMSLHSIATQDELVELKEVQTEFFDVFNKIDACIWDYRNQYELPLSRHEPISILKYTDGAQYRTHWDGSPSNGRIMSMVAYLNDGYEGGELRFPLFDYTYTPEAGSVLFFPSDYIYRHTAYPVTKGVKYSMVTWFQ